MKLGHFLHWGQRGTCICCYFLLTLPWVFNWHNYLQWPVCTTPGSPEPTVSLWQHITAPNASYCNVNLTFKLTADGNPTADDSEIHLLLYLHVLFIYQRSTFCSANMRCWIFGILFEITILSVSLRTSVKVWMLLCIKTCQYPMLK